MRVVIYATLLCPYCIRAKVLLSQRGVRYELVDVTGDRTMRQWLLDTTGRRTVPQIFIDDVPIGGFKELQALDRSGKLG